MEPRNCKFCGTPEPYTEEIEDGTGRYADGYSYVLICEECQAQGPPGENEEEAIEKWNRGSLATESNANYGGSQYREEEIIGDLLQDLDEEEHDYDRDLEAVVPEKETVVREKETVVSEKEIVVPEKEAVFSEKEAVVLKKEVSEPDLEITERPLNQALGRIVAYLLNGAAHQSKSKIAQKLYDMFDDSFLEQKQRFEKEMGSYQKYREKLEKKKKKKKKKK